MVFPKDKDAEKWSALGALEKAGTHHKCGIERCDLCWAKYYLMTTNDNDYYNFGSYLSHESALRIFDLAIENATNYESYLEKHEKVMDYEYLVNYSGD